MATCSTASRGISVLVLKAAINTMPSLTHLRATSLTVNVDEAQNSVLILSLMEGPILLAASGKLLTILKNLS